MADLTYRVTTETSTPRYGHNSVWLRTPQKLADAVAEETRIVRPDVTGPLTIHVWPSRDDEHYRLPIPADAQRFDYPA